jgi:hypothetical protein
MKDGGYFYKIYNTDKTLIALRLSYKIMYWEVWITDPCGNKHRLLYKRQENPKRKERAFH